ncbi:adenylate/guanylate cyclase domain-containing protein [Rapidithrix thailandica]|uniref:Adenylate/guanylate cyclase domain-containing protein n=1 Tax=Rapidithrix thailandica TaxID=413964 RepID=A0AAW9RVK0_9BACT
MTTHMVKHKTKLILQDWLFILIAWQVAIGISNLHSWAMLDFIDSQAFGAFSSFIHSNWAIWDGVFFGLFFGTLFAIIHTFSEYKLIRKLSFSRIILVKSGLYLLALILSSGLIFCAYWFLDIFPRETDWNFILKFIQPRFFIVGSIYMTFFILLINFLVLINRKFGHGNLWKFILGTYHKPKDENRIFMFLDLKGSTSIAEKLGHNLYSQMIQNCFHDLTDFVVKYKAEIYQYVGDEVVLTWTTHNGLENLNCIRLFFDFQQALEKRKAYYFKKFAHFPEFKAGMAMGPVTVVEIGDIKREIAYHGDVLNTAARIQSKCNEFGKPLLISENLESTLHQIAQTPSEFIGNIQLKGKENHVRIYAIDNGYEGPKQNHKVLVMN